MNSIYSRYFAGLVLSFFLAQSACADVFIGAHPDDIELFMNRNVSVDIYTGIPTVLVVLTAGDAGNGASGNNIHDIPYFRSRLIAHEYAARYWASLTGGPVPKSVYSTENFLSFNIEKVQIKHLTIYNLNLPDGGGGEGYAATGFSSLTKLYAQQIPSITSVDGKNTYTLAQLKAVLRLLISRNNAGIENVWLNFQDNDLSYNQGTHPDHKATGDIVNASIDEDAKFSCLNLALYQDYIISGFAENLNEQEKNIHVGTWGALNVGLTNSGNANTWDTVHNPWLGRQYYRVITGGACSF